jgi:hypothetical protein
MDRQNNRTPHAHLNPSFDLRAGLFPLGSALIAAEKLTPPRAPRAILDSDEILAVRLIEGIRHPQPVMFPSMRVESPQPFPREAILEMAGRHA